MISSYIPAPSGGPGCPDQVDGIPYRRKCWMAEEEIVERAGRHTLWVPAVLISQRLLWHSNCLHFSLGSMTFIYFNFLPTFSTISLSPFLRSSGFASWFLSTLSLCLFEMSCISKPSSAISDIWYILPPILTSYLTFQWSWRHFYLDLVSPQNNMSKNKFSTFQSPF